MKKIGAFVYVFQNSLFSPDYYRQILKSPTLFSIKYLFFLLFLLSILTTIPKIFNFYTFVLAAPAEIDSLKMTAPISFPKDLELTWKNGILSTSVREPYTIDFPLERGVVKRFITIDTTAGPDDYDKAGSYILMTKKSFVYPESKDNSRTRVLNYAKIKSDFFLNYQTYQDLLKKLWSYLDYLPMVLWAGFVLFVIVAPVLATGLNFVLKLLNILLVSAILFIVFKFVKHNVAYGSIFRIVVHSSTIPIVLFTILSIVKFSVPVPFVYLLSVLTISIINIRHAVDSE